jgi:hypothetical protein
MEKLNLNNPNKEITINHFLKEVKSFGLNLICKWRLFLAFILVGSGLGFLYAYLKPVKYLSKITFVVEESKAGGGGIAALAGQFGFDIGGMGGNGFFSGDNVLFFLSSEVLCRETLMTSYDEKSKILLIDKYAEVMGFKKKWLRNSNIGNVDFSKYTLTKLPRKEDSLLQVIIREEILKKDFAVSKPDKKTSFVTVSASMRDEMLSKLFSERLVNIATQKYITSKTKVKVANIEILQRRADSLSSLLNNKTYIAAATQQVLVDANPAIRTAPINSEISSREKGMIATIFGEVVKNLEISKTILSQETPVIEIVDVSSFPLKDDKIGFVKASLLAGFLSFLFFIAFLFISNWLKIQLKK